MRRTAALVPVIWLFSAAGVAGVHESVAERACPPGSGVALQILGSGGPVADDGRASTAYLVWIDGRARVLVDAGGGAFVRFAEAGARFDTLELIALSHFHADHAADLPAILKSGYFSDRARPLPISGPAAGGPFPGLEEFLSGSLDSNTGTYRYLDGYLDGSGGLVKLEPAEIDHRAGVPALVLEQSGLKVTALGVPHGIVPAVAYRVDAGKHSIVFGADQTARSEAFPGFARGADMLVAHMAIPENAGRGARSLHATPSAIGEMARDSGARRLVLSHFMARSLADLDENLAFVRRSYAGNTVLAEDLACLRP